MAGMLVRINPAVTRRQKDWLEKESKRLGIGETEVLRRALDTVIRLQEAQTDIPNMNHVYGKYIQDT